MGYLRIAGASIALGTMAVGWVGEEKARGAFETLEQEGDQAPGAPHVIAVRSAQPFYQRLLLKGDAVRIRRGEAKYGKEHRKPVREGHAETDLCD
jgi:hypothetical protein